VDSLGLQIEKFFFFTKNLKTFSVLLLVPVPICFLTLTLLPLLAKFVVSFTHEHKQEVVQSKKYKVCIVKFCTCVCFRNGLM